MDRPSESDLAWDVVEQNRSYLDVAELNAIFVKLGAGTYESVIAAVLKAVVREGATVEPELLPRLAAWIDGYDGGGEHARLRGLLARGSASGEAPG